MESIFMHQKIKRNTLGYLRKAKILGKRKEFEALKMSNNEINEMFSYISKGNQISSQRVRQLFSCVYKELKPENSGAENISKPQFENMFTKVMKSPNLDNELLYLFYCLDTEKKGYLTPENIMKMFEAVERGITLNQIENSFKYAKVYKNKMSFEDFKEYFHNF